jgi:hypothetical protein
MPNTTSPETLADLACTEIGRTYFSGNTLAPTRSTLLAIVPFSDLSEKERNRQTVLGNAGFDLFAVYRASGRANGGRGCLPLSVWVATHYETAAAMSEAYASRAVTS